MCDIAGGGGGGGSVCVIVLMHATAVKRSDEDVGDVRACATFAMKAAAMVGGEFGELHLHLCVPKLD